MAKFTKEYLVSFTDKYGLYLQETNNGNYDVISGSTLILTYNSITDKIMVIKNGSFEIEEPNVLDSWANENLSNKEN